MSNLCKKFDSSFYDFDYFERGRQTGKGWLENYHWMPKRSFREAFAFIEYMEIPDDAHILDFGCAKGFLVRAFRELGYNADGCDISKYALSFAPQGCWNCETEWRKSHNNYTHIVCKDVLEHLDYAQLFITLHDLVYVAQYMMVVVPMGDNGKYRIPEYHLEISHQIIEDENWWERTFNLVGWDVIKDTNHVAGLKDNWFYIPNGNHVFVLERQYVIL